VTIPKKNIIPLTTSIADPDPGSGAFMPPGSGMGKISGFVTGMNNPDHISESLETIIWIWKIFKFFHADPGWKKFGSGIRNTAY
jgi:hypothetical protein